MTRNHVSSPTRDASHYNSTMQLPPLLSSAATRSTTSLNQTRCTITPDSDYGDYFEMADAASALSRGALARIAGGENIEDPVLQCVQIKPMASQTGGADRYRVVMNDSVNFIQGMITQQLNNLVTDDQLRKGSICRLKQFQPNFVKDKWIIIILDLEIIEEYGEPEKIGQPVALEVTKPEEQDVKPQPGAIAGNSFYGQKQQGQAQQQQQQQQQQQRNLPSRSNGTSGSSYGNITPIEALSPYGQKWTIKARCTFKGEIKTWHNKNGEGKLFSVNFLDESGEIRATGFNDAVDSWYDILQEGGIYYVSSPCKVQMAKKQFSNLNNDYELTFERDTKIEKAEDTNGVPQVRFNFTTLADLQSVEKDATIDCIGILRRVDETSQITGKTSGKPYSKRDLTIADDTGFDIRLTIWGKTAETFDAPVESVVAFKGVKVSDFNGRSLSLLSSGTMTIDPDIDEAYKLKGWYDGAGRNEQFQSHASSMAAITSGGGRDQTKTIAQIRDENLGMNEEKPDYFNLKATIIYVKNDTYCYPACQTEGCNKKVVEVNVGEWRCEKCDKAFDRPEYRYIMSINVSDHTGQIWLSCFNDTGEQIIGMSANDLVAIAEEGDPTKVSQICQEGTCKTFIFRVRAKMETFSDQQRVRYQVQSSNPINYSQEAKKLADLIKVYNIDSDSLFVN